MFSGLSVAVKRVKKRLPQLYHGKQVGIIIVFFFNSKFAIVGEAKVAMICKIHGLRQVNQFSPVFTIRSVNLCLLWSFKVARPWRLMNRMMAWAMFQGKLYKATFVSHRSSSSPLWTNASLKTWLERESRAVKCSTCSSKQFWLHQFNKYSGQVIFGLTLRFRFLSLRPIPLPATNLNSFSHQPIPFEVFWIPGWKVLGKTRPRSMILRTKE